MINKNFIYPLHENAFSRSDIRCGIKVLKSRKITMGKETRKFEKFFAKKFGVNYALMVNSGSSANLLATFVSKNPLREKRFKDGDEVLLPVLCWPTSLWPLVQAGLKPIFVDIDMETLNINLADLKRKITRKTKVIMNINVLGLSSDLFQIKKICKNKKIILIEDNCESLGSKYKNKLMGTFGEFGTFSFYYSHQITSGEGGMVVCHTRSDYELLYALRAHGWSRSPYSYNRVAKENPNLDPRFIFTNMGFNLRPTDVQAAIGFNQLKRLNQFSKNRKINRTKIIKALKESKKWKNQFSFLPIPNGIDPSWFSLVILINEKFLKKKKKFINFLTSKGIETRPIISGNFIKQPAAKLFRLNKRRDKFPNADKIDKKGFFIGLKTSYLSRSRINYLVNNLLQISEI